MHFTIVYLGLLYGYIYDTVRYIVYYFYDCNWIHDGEPLIMTTLQIVSAVAATTTVIGSKNGVPEGDDIEKVFVAFYIAVNIIIVSVFIIHNLYMSIKEYNNSEFRLITITNAVVFLFFVGINGMALLFWLTNFIYDIL